MFSADRQVVRVINVFTSYFLFSLVVFSPTERYCVMFSDFMSKLEQIRSSDSDKSGKRKSAKDVL